MKDTTIGFRIDEVEKEALKKVCDKEDISMSQLLRRIIKQYIAEHQEQK